MGTEDKTKLIDIKKKLKGKTGDGGFQEGDLEKAQHAIDSNEVDFTPTIKKLLGQLKTVLTDAKKINDYSTETLEALKEPILQLKSQGAMFHFPVYTDISSGLLEFLEKVGKIDSDMLNIVTSFYNTLELIHKEGIKDSSDKTAEQLNTELNFFYTLYLDTQT